MFYYFSNFFHEKKVKIITFVSLKNCAKVEMEVVENIQKFPKVLTITFSNKNFNKLKKKYWV